MPVTRVIKHKPAERTAMVVEAKPKLLNANQTLKAQTQLKVPTTRKPRASSCPRDVHGDRGRGSTEKTPNIVSTTKCDRRVRSTSTSRQHTGPCVKKAQSCLKTTGSAKQPPATSNPDDTTPASHKQTQCCRPKGYYAIQSHKAFTVIPPNPKKRKEIQRKAEAELAALEDLRLSRAMAYVSINPSSVGGCMSLEEVRLKQQQEMQAGRRQRQMKKYLVQPTPVLSK